MAYFLLVLKAQLGAFILTLVSIAAIEELKGAVLSPLQSTVIGVIIFAYILVDGLWEMADWE